jgi:uncharacterized protein (UPF0332 family)
MLDKKTIEGARTNVRRYLDQGLLAQERFQEIVSRTLIDNSRESLETADFLAKNNKSRLWVIVCSYYSMFYIANAVLYKLGYKVGDQTPHKVTSDALIVYVKDKLRGSLLENYQEIKEEALLLAQNKAEGLIENFDKEREKRGRIQYRTEEVEKTAKANTSLQRAKEFVKEMEKLLVDLNK